MILEQKQSNATNNRVKTGVSLAYITYYQETNALDGVTLLQTKEKHFRNHRV